MYGKPSVHMDGSTAVTKGLHPVEVPEKMFSFQYLLMLHNNRKVTHVNIFLCICI